MPGGHDYFYTLQEICVLLNLLPNTFRQIAREYGDIVVIREQTRKGRAVLGLPRADFEVLRTIVEMRGRGLSSDEIRAALGRSGRGSARAPARAVPGEGAAESREVSEAAGEGPGGKADPGRKPAQAAARDWSETGAGHAGEPGAENRVGEATDETLSSLEEGATADASLREGTGQPVTVAEKGLLAEIAALREELRKMDEHRREERDKLLTALMRTQHELQSLRYEVGVSLSRRDRKKKRGFWAWLFDL